MSLDDQTKKEISLALDTIKKEFLKEKINLNTMPSLKDLRNRIDSVKSTKKITQAMKMVAASKLKKAQNLAEKSRNYSAGIEDIVRKILLSEENLDHPLIGTSEKEINKSLVIVVSSDRGLCGGLNTNLIKKTKLLVKDLESQNKNVTIVCIGKKGYDALSLYYENNFNYNFKFINITDIDYTSLQSLGNDIIKNFSKGNFNECFVLYNFFKSVISQEVKIERILPYKKVTMK